MTTSAAATAESHPTNSGANFRVNDHGRLLGVATAALLLLGFNVLRLLIGPGDTPHVDTTSSDQSLQVTPQADEAADEIHRMRPQTSTTLSEAAITGQLTQPVLSDDQGWNQLPLNDWPSDPNAANSARDSLDVAFGADLLR